MEEQKTSNTRLFRWGSCFNKKPQSTSPTDSTELLQLAIQVGHLFVHGGEDEVTQGLALVEQNSKILDCKVVIKDRKKRQLKGYLISIAAMIDETRLSTHMLLTIDEIDPKKTGIVNQLIEINHRKKCLLPATILEHLQVVLSPEAKKINMERTEKFLNAVIKFGEGLQNLKDPSQLEMTSVCLKSLISEYEQKLETIIGEIYTAGFLFDLNILLSTIKWFIENEDTFGNSQYKKSYEETEVEIDPLFWKRTSLFWVIGFGKLQDLMSSRDVHFLLHGHSEEPPRSIQNKDGTSYFDSNSGLGSTYCIDILSKELKYISDKVLPPIWTMNRLKHHIRIYENCIKARDLSFTHTVLAESHQKTNRFVR